MEAACFSDMSETQPTSARRKNLRIGLLLVLNHNESLKSVNLINISHIITSHKLWLVIIWLSYLEGIEEKGYLSARNFCATQCTTLSLVSGKCKKPMTEKI